MIACQHHVAMKTTLDLIVAKYKASSHHRPAEPTYTLELTGPVREGATRKRAHTPTLPTRFLPGLVLPPPSLFPPTWASAHRHLAQALGTRRATLPLPALTLALNGVCARLRSR